MAGFKAWVKKHLQSTPTAEKHPKNQLPFLAIPRRPVTPISFDIPTSLFFQLPYDIRSLILLMALGNRAIHIDLELQERGWQWRGAVCGCRYQSGMPSKGYPRSYLWNDNCQKYSLSHNGGKSRPYYNLEVAGFLLSCKQAYAEGIHVLWSANTILISSEPLLLHLPSLIAPARLSSLTSLEILLTINRPRQPNNGPSSILDPLQSILSTIKSYCPQLRGFALSFYLASVTEHIASGRTLALIDAFYRSMRLRNMRVEVPYITLLQLRRHRLPLQQHPREKPADSRQIWLTSWRALDWDEPRVEERSCERYPGPPLRLPRSENEDHSLESKGYWLVMGEDMPMRHCFSECGNRP